MHQSAGEARTFKPTAVLYMSNDGIYKQAYTSMCIYRGRHTCVHIRDAICLPNAEGPCNHPKAGNCRDRTVSFHYWGVSME